jgi:hypothetical protein
LSLKYETRPRLPFDCLTLHRKGPRLRSRYDVISELHLMHQAVDAMSDRHAALLHLLCCDSKAGACYTAHTDAPPAAAREIAAELQVAFVALDGGHNGIDVCNRRGDLIARIEPDWPAEDRIRGDTAAH